MIGAWIGSAISWHRSQAQKRRQDEYNRKESLYRALLGALAVFYAGRSSEGGASPFVDQVRLAWLYAPDEVMHKLYAFLNTQKEGIPASEKNEAGRRTMAEVVAAMRTDLFQTVKRETTLSADDYQHLT